MYIIRPKDFAIKGSQNREPDKVAFTSISKLEQTVEGEKSFMRSCLLLQILYYKKAKVDDKTAIYSCATQQDKKRTFDRTITVMCLNSPKGRNTSVILLQSSGNANTIFCHFTDGPVFLLFFPGPM